MKHTSKPGLLALLTSIALAAGGCVEQDKPMSFLPPAPDGGGEMDSGSSPPAEGGADGAGLGANRPEDAGPGGSFEASWCEPDFEVFYNDVNDYSLGSFSVSGTLSRSKDPSDPVGQISISVLTMNPVAIVLAGDDPEEPVVQLLIRDCDWSDESDTLDFTIEDIPKKSGDDYFFATFYDVAQQDRPLTVTGGDLSATAGPVDVPRLNANPSGDSVEMDLDQNAIVPNL